MSYLVMKPKTKREENILVEIARLLDVPVEKSDKETMAEIHARQREVLAWARSQDRKMRAVKKKPSDDEIAAIVSQNRKRHAKK